MRRYLLGLCLFATLAAPLPADDAAKDDAQKDEAAAPAEPTAESIKADPNDADAMRTYVVQELRAASAVVDDDPDAAEKRMNELSKLLDGLEPEEEDAKDLLRQAKAAVSSFESRLAIARVTLEELTKSLAENPDDAKTLSTFVSKVTLEIGSLARTEPDKAEEILNAAKKTLEEVDAATEDEATKSLVVRSLASLARYEDRIADGKKIAALIGADATPLKVEAWVNGSPLTDADLEGKVVLLDFWAVWCGPCIATFPHLREWQEKYSDKGLVIVGLTRYYDYTWNEEAGRASRSSDDVEPEEEQKMLVKFAEQHELHHRFAIQSGSELSEYYAVGGIPHVVLIDRKGKVRLIRVGSGSSNAEEIGAMLEKLVADEG